MHKGSVKDTELTLRKACAGFAQGRRICWDCAEIPSLLVPPRRGDPSRPTPERRANFLRRGSSQNEAVPSGAAGAHTHRLCDRRLV